MGGSSWSGDQRMAVAAQHPQTAQAFARFAVPCNLCTIRGLPLCVRTCACVSVHAFMCAHVSQ